MFIADGLALSGPALFARHGELGSYPRCCAYVYGPAAVAQLTGCTWRRPNSAGPG